MGPILSEIDQAKKQTVIDSSSNAGSFGIQGTNAWKLPEAMIQNHALASERLHEAQLNGVAGFERFLDNDLAPRVANVETYTQNYVEKLQDHPETLLSKVGTNILLDTSRCRSNFTEIALEKSFTIKNGIEYVESSLNQSLNLGIERAQEVSCKAVLDTVGSLIADPAEPFSSTFASTFASVAGRNDLKENAVKWGDIVASEKNFTIDSNTINMPCNEPMADDPPGMDQFNNAMPGFYGDSPETEALKKRICPDPNNEIGNYNRQRNLVSTNITDLNNSTNSSNIDGLSGSKPGFFERCFGFGGSTSDSDSPMAIDTSSVASEPITDSDTVERNLFQRFWDSSSSSDLCTNLHGDYLDGPPYWLGCLFGPGVGHDQCPMDPGFIYMKAHKDLCMNPSESEQGIP